MKGISYIDSERICEAAFLKSGKWWHLFTPGNLTSLIFAEDDDYRFAMNLIARCISEFPEIRVIAFEIMSNHLHIVLSGDEMIIRDFFTILRRRLKRHLSTKGRTTLPDQFQMSLKPINDLKALRNTIVYVNRNGYVINSGHTPFTYPWGTGRYYFNNYTVSGKLSDMTDRRIRKMFRSRNPHIPDETDIIDGHVAPPAYCDIRLGMNMFRNAHQYFFMVSKNVESYEMIAAELDDGEYLTDTELFSQIYPYIRSSYGCNSLKDITSTQRQDLARKLRKDYRSSNGQIRRILGLTQYEVDSMFPLSAPTNAGKQMNV